MLASRYRFCSLSFDIDQPTWSADGSFYVNRGQIFDVTVNQWLGERVIAAELAKVRMHWNRLEFAMALGREGEFSVSVRKVFTASENLLQPTDKTVDLYARLPG